MTDDQQLLTERDRGGRAQRLLADPLIADAFAAVRADCDELFRTSSPTDDATRRWARLKLAAVTQVEELLRHHIDTGRLASSTLEEMKSRARRVADTAMSKIRSVA
jgi:hypothetical protein